MLKKFLVIGILFATSLFAIPKDEIKDTMSSNINKVLNILKQEDLSKKQKGEKIINIMDSSFDYKIMSMLSLGKKWRSIDKTKKMEFIKTFEQKLKDSYVDKLDLYTNQKIQINELKNVKKRLVLKTMLIGKDENFQIDYKFYKNKKNNEWYIYDVDIIGVSIIQTYRKQFSQYLKDKTIEDLIKFLKQKNSNKA